MEKGLAGYIFKKLYIWYNYMTILSFEKHKINLVEMFVTVSDFLQAWFGWQGQLREIML